MVASDVDVPTPSETAASSDESIMEPGAVPYPTALPEGCPNFICGTAQVRHEDRMEKHGYKRYRLQCTWHTGCSKFRNNGPGQHKNLGQWESLAYLACWNNLGAGIPKDLHGKKETLNKITFGDMRSWLDAEGLPHT